jgi:hypothetical protein
MKESGLLKAFLCKQNSGPLADPVMLTKNVPFVFRPQPFSQ